MSILTLALYVTVTCAKIILMLHNPYSGRNQIMGLQIIVGKSGSGKSTYIYEKVIKESQENPKRNYFIIVPDQFTMQTQMDLVTMSPCGGIMNIDVLSFSRLAHRIFEETGGCRKPVLDDTGKSLILRKVAADLKDKTVLIGPNLDKQGYIHEVKSAISEFMQYGIGQEELKQLIEYAKEKGSLHYKLQDLAVLYEGFGQYIKDHYITTEESMDILAEELLHSKLVQDCVVVFDGFTGFTPIQNKVIATLMELCKQVVLTLTINPEELTEQNDQDLFSLSKKTYHTMVKLAEDKQVTVEPLIAMPGMPVYRFRGKEELAFLEQNLFRYPFMPYTGEKENRIQIRKSLDIHEEVREVCREIQRVLKKTGCCYRNIAVITGDLSVYESEIEEAFTQYAIPFFMDKTRGILLNPFTEFLKAVLDIIQNDFSYESVFRYLKSVMVDFTKDETDDLENYVLELGIRGKGTWNRVFAGRTKAMKRKESAVEELGYVNQLRERLMNQLTSVLDLPKTGERVVKEYIEKLYAFIVDNHCSEKLNQFEMLFSRREDYTKAKEFGQIYRLIMELFDQIMDLVGEEKMSIKDFSDILDAGLNEIEVGSIPQSVDRIIVGDMERTRLKPTQYLFFMGLNDGLIPKNGGKGGIISDMEREFLTGSNFELAPSPRQQMYIQKFYLYLNMTKPSEKLYLSFASMNSEGSASRPSYLISMIDKMFPDAFVQHKEEHHLEQLLNMGEIKEYFCTLLRRYADGCILKQERIDFLTLLSLFREEDAQKEFVMHKIEQAFDTQREKALQQMVAGVLYGHTLHSSISRMEQYASCAYAYFLQYGISLKDRELYGFEDRDIGTIFHGVLEHFSDKLIEHNYTWFNFPKDEGAKMVEESLLEVSSDYSDAVLFDNAQNRYTLQRMKRILTRAVNTISYQLGKGRYVPEAFEVSFSVSQTLEDMNIALNEQEKMKLTGRIDRLDTYEDEDHVYVKVVDYKSGNKDFNLAAFYHGLQLQLVVYLNEALKTTAQKHPGKEVVPAALLYYHVADPLIDGDEDMSEEAINQKIYQELRTRGIVNSDASVINALDTTQTKKSDCIPVEYKTDGSFTSNSSVMSPENMKLISDFASYKLRKMGSEICKGKIPINPVTQGTKDSCTYCLYKDVCGFDERISSLQKREIAKEEEADLLDKMQQDMKGEA